MIEAPRESRAVQLRLNDALRQIAELAASVRDLNAAIQPTVGAAPAAAASGTGASTSGSSTTATTKTSNIAASSVVNANAVGSYDLIRPDIPFDTAQGVLSGGIGISISGNVVSFVGPTPLSITTSAAVSIYNFVYADATAGAITASLPAAIGSQLWINIKKADASSNNVVITAAGSDLIDGLATYTLTGQYTCISLFDFAPGVWLIWALYVNP